MEQDKSTEMLGCALLAVSLVILLIVALGIVHYVYLR
jgi:hypothetical protein